MKALDPIRVRQKTGQELFHRSGDAANRSLLDFWQWSGSDLLGNTARGILAEYIVAMDLGAATGIWSGWDPYDIKTKDGTKVEVKSAAYIQTWRQKSFSRIEFGIGPTEGWDPDSGERLKGKKRWSDVYVFCVLATKEADKVDPMDLDQWEFYVLPAATLDKEVPRQQRIALSSLVRIGAIRADYGTIGVSIRSCLSR